MESEVRRHDASISAASLKEESEGRSSREGTSLESRPTVSFDSWLYGSPSTYPEVSATAADDDEGGDDPPCPE